MTPNFSKQIWRLVEEINFKREYHLLEKDLPLCDHEMFFSQFKINPTKFDELLSHAALLIIKVSEKREPVGPSEKLSVTLPGLVTGDAQSTISLSYRKSKTSVE